MKNKLDNRDDYDVGDSNSLNGLNDKDIAKKFDEQMDTLKEIAKAEAKEKNDNWDGDLESKLKEIDNAFEKVDTEKERKVVEKYKGISDRNIDIQVEIKASGKNILSEVKNWKNEKDIVAKSLLRIADWILKTEK